MKKIAAFFLILASIVPASAQDASADFMLARIRYSGGGDWYNDASSLVNLARYMNTHCGMKAAEKETAVSMTLSDLSANPICFITGHGGLTASDAEAAALREYLLSGGFLYADDDYGMDSDFRRFMKRVFPARDWQELPFSHGIYREPFAFPNGLPKIHEHDNKPPRGLALMDDNGRIMVYYTVETNLADGWADARVHDNPPEKREAALKMGSNIIYWALTH